MARGSFEKMEIIRIFVSEFPAEDFLFSHDEIKILPREIFIYGKQVFLI